MIIDLFIWFGSLGKRIWPELVGIEATIAEKIIKKENSSVSFVQIIILESGSPITSDFRCYRVRLRVNINGVIVGIPSIG